MVLLYFSDGWYCIQGAANPMPSDPSVGGRCQAGEYCPGGTEAAIPCEPGWYCHRAGLAEPQLLCRAGKTEQREIIGVRQKV